MPQEPTDRVWVGFTEMPKLRLELTLFRGEREVKDWGWAVKRILQVLEDRLIIELNKSAVFPNMADIPFPFSLSMDRD
jgi:hypothetical protein